MKPLNQTQCIFLIICRRLIEDSSKTQNQTSFPEQIDTSREIMVSEDFKRDLNHRMEHTEDDTEEVDYNYKNHMKPPRIGHRGSFGQADQTESEKYDIRSTPKMGPRKTKQSEEKENINYDEREELQHHYGDQTIKTEDIDTEIGLNFSNVDIQNKKFSDLVINNTKANREALKEKINQNQSLYEEYTETFEGKNFESSSKPQESSQQQEIYEEATGTEESSVNGPKVMHAKSLADQYLLNRDQSWADKKVNSSCIVTSKSHSDLGFRGLKSHSRESTTLDMFCNTLMLKLSALETDIARNMRNIRSKFEAQDHNYKKLVDELNSLSGDMDDLDKKYTFVDKTQCEFSERLDEFHKMIQKTDEKILNNNKYIEDLEQKFHELDLAQKENSRNEILNTSISINQEVDAKLKNIEAKMYNLETKLSSNEDRTKRLETHTQRSSNSESRFDRKYEQLESNFRENLDQIYSELNSVKIETKKEILDEMPNFDHIRDLEQHIQSVDNTQDSIEKRIYDVEKELQNGPLSESLKEDLSKIQNLSSSISKINDNFKEETFNLEAKIKENHVKILDCQNK